MDHRIRFHRSFLLVLLLVQVCGFNGEEMSGTRRAVEILSGQKSTALIPPTQGVAAAFGDSDADLA
ncbi:hypothetical protein [Aurantimonas sp. 22II-16-19i]|uniref:hypothetical protein n=1 Tax=Aurantimonas sp. 22II-16-19i TaxID=1317114 RepID=UPI0009F7EA64|nr:hypothetical protein [Aurantimonas sp. 22II-16-19i]ORE93991.1 hypothetical protein ATO4_14594 [Aurantimonas sp. 22II-16-19i]